MDPIVCFFLFGVITTLLGVNLKIPKSSFEFISYYLLISIGLKGGLQLSNQNPLEIIPQALLIGSMGILLPILAYPVLKKWGGFQKIDAASIAAHYGSVSIGTFAVSVAYLHSMNVSFEAHTPVFVVLLEIPAILVGTFLAKGRSAGKNWGSLFKEIFLNKSVVLLLGGLFIGWVGTESSMAKMEPLFFDLFYGFLALFLLEMGITAAKEASTIRQKGAFLVGFGVLMPLVSAMIGLGFATLAGLSVGGTALIAVLAASASYIAVPAALKMSVPEANLALPIGASLGITFPFNVLLGIPLYYSMSVWIHG